MTIEYFNSLAASWDENYAEKDVAKLEKMAARIDIEPGSKVIDIGCGTGVLVPFILKKIGLNGSLVCLDFAAEMLNTARSKGFMGNISYICADVTNTGIGDATFDAAICYSSFPHFNDKPKALREINRLLKTEGKLFICHTSSRRTINNIHGNIPVLNHDIIPDENGMREMLSTAGFIDAAVEDLSHSYFVRAIEGSVITHV
jgi:ubiquinone/menaquinone biosynthesis C-methylase UbiE